LTGETTTSTSYTYVRQTGQRGGAKTRYYLDRVKLETLGTQTSREGPDDTYATMPRAGVEGSGGLIRLEWKCTTSLAIPTSKKLEHVHFCEASKRSRKIGSKQFPG